LKEWTTPDFRNTPSTTGLVEEEIVDALGNDGNASMPEQVSRPNPWRKVFERYAYALWAGLPLTGTLLGNLEGICLPGHLREMNSTFVNLEVTRVLSLSEALTSLRHIYLGSFLLDPEDNRK
jgi:hypothetical protein